MSRKPNRARAVPIQVYVSSSELDALRRLAKRRDATVAELVRGWIRRATAATKAREPKPVLEEDPRQLRIAGPSLPW